MSVGRECDPAALERSPRSDEPPLISSIISARRWLNSTTAKVKTDVSQPLTGKADELPTTFEAHKKINPAARQRSGLRLTIFNPTKSRKNGSYASISARGHLWDTRKQWRHGR